MGAGMVSEALAVGSEDGLESLDAYAPISRSLAAGDLSKDQGCVSRVNGQGCFVMFA